MEATSPRPPPHQGFVGDTGMDDRTAVEVVDPWNGVPTINKVFDYLATGHPDRLPSPKKMSSRSASKKSRSAKRSEGKKAWAKAKLAKRPKSERLVGYEEDTDDKHTKKAGTEMLDTGEKRR